MKKRTLWCVTISRTWIHVYNTTLRIRYKPALSLLLSMKSGYSQAMGRFFLTHSVKMSLGFEDCLKTLGVTREEKKVWHAIKSDIPLLAKLGVTFEGRMIRYEQKKGMVSFENPSHGQNPSLGNTA